ncbi:MAG TPA: sensor histidine kinase [Jiangellales bacterium]|nr:sensor histidine kinase [Jiangellales bacterium]
MTGPGETGRSFWERSLVGWHAAFYGVLGVVAVLLLLEPDPETPYALTLALLAVMGGSYWLWGRPALGRDDPRLALPYLVPAWIAFLVIVRTEPGAYFLLFVLIPQIWALLPTRWAVGWSCLAVSGLVAVQLLENGLSPDSLRNAALTGVLNLGLSLLLGLWITGIVRESDQRAELISELERTRSELAEAEHSRGVLAERERLAAEIHDTLAQGFTSIVALCQATDGVLATDPSAARDRLAMIERTARDNLAEARALVAALGPVDLEDTTLPDAVRRLADRVSREVGVTVEVVVEGTAHPLPADREVVLLRAAQEALANVRKHAAASHVRLRLVYEGTGATVEVRDDGRGFDPDSAGGFGLRGMGSRAAAVGGRLTVDSAPGGGTVVALSVP